MGSIGTLTCVAYNFLLNKHSQESPFFLMFGRDSIVLWNFLLIPMIRYLGTDDNILSLEALENVPNGGNQFGTSWKEVRYQGPCT